MRIDLSPALAAAVRRSLHDASKSDDVSRHQSQAALVALNGNRFISSSQLALAALTLTLQEISERGVSAAVKAAARKRLAAVESQK